MFFKINLQLITYGGNHSKGLLVSNALFLSKIHKLIKYKNQRQKLDLNANYFKQKVDNGHTL